MVGCSVGLENLCLDNLDANADGSVVGWGVLVEVLVLLYGFLAVAIIADNHLVTSLETLCVRWNVREDVAGASFMAFGSAAPEIIINAVSTIKTVLAVSDGGAAAVAPEDAGEDTDLGIGAIIGSGMIAFTVIPGVCGLAAKEDLALKRRPLARDTGFYSLALALLCYAISDGLVEVHEAAVMVTLYVVYIAIVVFSSGVRRRRRAIPAAQFLCAILTSASASAGIAIAIHNIPEGVCVAMPIYYSTGSKWKGFLWSLFSGITEPIGGIIGFAVLQSVFTELVFGIVFAMVGGMMVFIVLHELLPTAHRYMPDRPGYVTFFLVVGMVVMAISLVLFAI